MLRVRLCSIASSLAKTQRFAPLLRGTAAEASSSCRLISTSALCGKGHSHWQNVAKTKEANDKKRSGEVQAFMNKLRIATKDGCFDPTLNNKLATLISDYRKASLPMDTFNKRLAALKEDAEKKKKASTDSLSATDPEYS